MAGSFKSLRFWTQGVLSPATLPIWKIAAVQATDLQNLCLDAMQGAQDLQQDLLLVSVDCFGACAAGVSMTSVSNPVIHLNADVILCAFYMYYL